LGFKVRVQVHGHVRRFLPAVNGEAEVELEGPAPVREVLERIGLSPDVFAGIFLDGARVDVDHLIEGEAELLLLSPAAGGGL